MHVHECLLGHIVYIYQHLPQMFADLLPSWIMFAFVWEIHAIYQLVGMFPVILSQTTDSINVMA